MSAVSAVAVNYLSTERDFTHALHAADIELVMHSDNDRSVRAICFVMSMYHDAPRVRAFAGHLRRLALPRDVELHVLVADNGLGPRAPRVRGAEVFASPGNLGYLGGCVHALESWRTTGQAYPEWVCVSNSDLELADDFLLRLAGEEWPEDGGIAAPDVRLLNGVPQNPLLWRRPARAMMLAYAVLARSRIFALSFEAAVRARHAWRGVLGAESRPVNAAVYAPHGSIVAIHRRFFERGAELRYHAMMFGEEIHLAEQARRAGLQVLLRNDLQVVHDQHGTLRHVRHAQRHRWLAESAAVLWRDYFADPDGAAARES